MSEMLLSCTARLHAIQGTNLSNILRANSEYIQKASRYLLVIIEVEVAIQSTHVGNSKETYAQHFNTTLASRPC
jgi:hypothetical protein